MREYNGVRESAVYIHFGTFYIKYFFLGKRKCTICLNYFFFFLRLLYHQIKAVAYNLDKGIPLVRRCLALSSPVTLKTYNYIFNICGNAQKSQDYLVNYAKILLSYCFRLFYFILFLFRNNNVWIYLLCRCFCHSSSYCFKKVIK